MTNRTALAFVIPSFVIRHSSFFYHQITADQPLVPEIIPVPNHKGSLTIHSMKWISFLTALLLSPLTALHAADAPPHSKPNILFLFSDDQRADTIAGLGNSHIRTPQLDLLAEHGTVFSRAYCMGANQGAVCVPSRAMLMSGRTLFRVSEKLQNQGTWPE